MQEHIDMQSNSCYQELIKYARMWLNHGLLAYSEKITLDYNPIIALTWHGGAFLQFQISEVRSRDYWISRLLLTTIGSQSELHETQSFQEINMFGSQLENINDNTLTIVTKVNGVQNLLLLTHSIHIWVTSDKTM